MSKFVDGFLKEAKEHGIGEIKARLLMKLSYDNTSINQFLNTFLPASHDSLNDVANNIDHTPGDKTSNIIKELGGIAGHVGEHGIKPGLLGAGAGALIGFGTEKDADRKKKMLQYALLGGGLGFGAGAMHDAYHLGNNTRHDVKTDLESSLNDVRGLPPEARSAETAANRSNLSNQLSNIKDTHWYDYFFPKHIDAKLNKR